MENQIKIDPVVIGKDQMDQITRLFSSESGGAEPVLARQLTNEVSVDYPELITYEGLKDGTAKLFDTLPSFQSMSPTDRRLTDSQIISLFAVDEQGDPIKDGTFAGGFAREIGPQLTSMGGAYYGAKTGMALQSGIPPVTPWSVVAKVAIPTVTTIAGALGLYNVGKEGVDLIMGPEKPITPGSRAAYEAGKTAAGAAGWLPMPFMISKNVSFGAAQLLDNLAEGVKGPLSTRLIAGVERLLSKTGTAARQNKARTAFVETVAGTGASAGTYIAETVDPGDASTRLALEIPFGISGGILADRIPSLVSGLKYLKEQFGKLRRGEFQIRNRRQQQAAFRIVDILESEGEDVAAVIERLSSKEFQDALIDPDTGKPITLTAGMKANSPGLLAIEASLTQTSPGLGKEKIAKNVQANNALRNTIAALVATGDRNALQIAAQLEEDVFSASLNDKLARAADNVVKASERVRGANPESNMELSQKLFEVASSQLSQARNVENRLWAAVDDLTIDEFFDVDGNELDVPNFISAWDESIPVTKEAADEIKSKLGRLTAFVERKKKELGLEEAAEEIGEEAAEAVEEEIIPLTVNEIKEMRTLALGLSRQLSASQDFNAARVASNFANGLLDDLNNSIPTGENSAYDIARAYSRSLNDVFTRAFAGRVFDKSKTGANRLSPELLAQRLQSGGSDPTYLRVKQINDIGQFAIDNGFEGAQDLATTIRGTQEMIIRNARAAAFDPNTGEINLKSLQRWVNSNKELLDTFPALRADLKNAERATVVLQGRQAQNKTELDKLKGEITFRDLLPNNTESPTFVVARALSSGQKAPLKSLNNLWRVVEKAPKELQQNAASGLKHAILEWAMTKGGATSRTFSPRAMYDSLFSKIPNANSDISVVDWMLSKGAIEQKQVDKLKQYLTEMVRLEIMDSQGTLKDIVETAGPLALFYQRVTGSALGGFVAKLTGDEQSLIMRSAGSRATQDLFGKIPESMKMDVMSELMENPDLLALLMSKPRTEKQKFRLTGALRRMLRGLGFIENVEQAPRRAVPQVIREDEVEEVELEQDVPGVSSPLTQLRTPALPTRSAAAPRPSPIVVAQAPVVSTPPAQQARPADRSRFAAMFPSDITSPLIKSQGIESLLG